MTGYVSAPKTCWSINAVPPQLLSFVRETYVGGWIHHLSNSDNKVISSTYCPPVSLILIHSYWITVRVVTIIHSVNAIYWSANSASLTHALRNLDKSEFFQYGCQRVADILYENLHWVISNLTSHVVQPRLMRMGKICKYEMILKLQDMYAQTLNFSILLRVNRL